MRFAGIVYVCLLSTSYLLADDGPLAGVRNLDCAHKEAVRFDQGATTQGRAGGPTAFVKIVASRYSSGNCDVRTTLHVKSGEQELEFPIAHNTNAGFELVDWSPNANLILVSSERWTDEFSAPLLTIYDTRQNRQRSIEVAALFAARGWEHCSAIVEATGFTPTGDIVVTAGPGSLQGRPKDCIANESYWTFDLQGRQLRQMPAGFRQKRYGKVVAPDVRPCKEDPNVVDACFTLRGRVFVSNGTPSLRIWRVGTDRILGVFDPENEIVPDNLAKRLDGYGVEVYGDFEVCPFTKSKPDEMQMVCVESASRLVAKRR
jgi:hypothetical protein